MKLLAIIVLVVFSSGLIAQEPRLRRKERKAFSEAKILLELKDYFHASERLTPLIKKYPDYAPFNYGMGICLLHTCGKEKEALALLEKGIDESNPDTHYWYARALHIHERFSAAIEAYMFCRNSSAKTINQGEVDHHLAKTRLAQTMLVAPRRVEVLNLGARINSEFQDAVPLITADESRLYFTSRRDIGSSKRKDPTGQYFQDIYYSEQTDSGWSKPKNMGAEFNSETHDATVGISANGNAMITYRTNDNLVGGDLYWTEFTSGKWQQPQKLGTSINSEFQEPCASITSDESVMYFSSNRPGEYGGMDIYRAKKLPNGAWSLPVNLGPSVNTAYDEDSPFISASGETLYFSSKGHPGIGGYDVFQSQLMANGEWSVPTNMECPINTVEDDIYFTINANERVAYYSSDMEGGYGDQDLYKIVFHDKVEDMAVFKGKVVNEVGTPVKAKVTVLKMNPERVNGVYRSSASRGSFIALLFPGEMFQMIVEADGYAPSIRYIDLLEATTKEEALEFMGASKIVLKKE